MNYRFFTIGFYTLFGIFIGLNAIIWFSWTRDITDPQRKGGDLLRIGYIQGFVSPHIQADNLSRHHMEAKDFSLKPVDMVTVGDSFSLGGSLKVGCYQDHIASLRSLSILNIPTQKELSFQPVTMLVRLINSGYLDRVRPKYLLLQTIEREAVNRLAHGVDLTGSATLDELEKEFCERKPTPLDMDRNLRFINNGNWQFVVNNIQYRFSDEAFSSNVVVSQLKQPFFSTRRGDILIFHRHDIAAARKATPPVMAKVNDNLNLLADILRVKGITLVFMPVPDKLTLYEPYLNNRTYPKSIFFEELRKLPKRYHLIDAKQILSRELAAGTLDLYYQGDTHWTWKACEAIAKGFTLN
jgi:hypothetical protein